MLLKSLSDELRSVVSWSEFELKLRHYSIEWVTASLKSSLSDMIIWANLDIILLNSAEGVFFTVSK